MQISQEKKQEARKNLVSTVKFCAVFCPLLVVYGVPSWFQAHAEIPIYHRDCRSAPTVIGPLSSSYPCYHEIATAQLQSYYGRSGGRDVQKVCLTFSDGRTSSTQPDGNSNTWWNASEVDGPCLAEVWHGEIRAVLKPGARILSKENPELLGDTSALMTFVVFPSALTLGVWIGLFVLWQKGDLSKKKN